MDPLRTRLLCLAFTLLTFPGAAVAGGWLDEPGVRRRLAAGDVAVQTVESTDSGQPRGRVLAAVRIKASSEAIWAIMTDCRQMLLFVPGLRSCRRIDGAADGRWADIEHEVRYSWLLPTIRYVLRVEYDRPRRIDFRTISGDLRDEQGSWQLTPAPDGSTTLLEYDVYVDPGFWIPRFVVLRSLRRDLPAALTGLKDRAEHPTDTH